MSQFAYKNHGGNQFTFNGPSAPASSAPGPNRSLGAWYPTTHNSAAIRRYGGRGKTHNGAAANYTPNRALGSFHVPRPGAPEIVSGYESPEPGAATITLGCMTSTVDGYMPEGAARTYGSQMLADDGTPVATPPSTAAQAETDATTFLASPVVRQASVVAAAYHGVRRNNGSVFWGAMWALAAYVAPINGASAVAVAVAQGFGKPKSGC